MNMDTNMPALGGINQENFDKTIVKLEQIGAFSLMEGLLLGVDISSKVDYIYGFDVQGVEIKHACKCEELIETLDKKFDGAKLTVCIENCTGASALSEQLQRAGHNCVLMPTDYCVEFNQGNKDDCNDAGAIYVSAMAARRHNCKNRNLSSRSLKYQLNAFYANQRAAIKCNSRLRSMVHNERTFLSDQERGMGIMLYKCMLQKTADLNMGFISEKDFKFFAAVMADEYSSAVTHAFNAMRGQMRIIDELHDDPTFQRLLTIPGIGPGLAAAFCILAHPIERFNSARSFTARAGKAPEHTGSGGKIKIGHLSKKGCKPLKAMLYEAASVCINRNKEFFATLLDRYCGNHKKAAIWLGAKLCRIAYACLKDPNFKYNGVKANLPKSDSTPKKKIARLFSLMKCKANEIAESAGKLCKLFRWLPVGDVFKNLLLHIRDAALHATDLLFDQSAYSCKLSKFFKEAMWEKHKEFKLCLQADAENEPVQTGNSPGRADMLRPEAGPRPFSCAMRA